MSPVLSKLGKDGFEIYPASFTANPAKRFFNKSITFPEINISKFHRRRRSIY